MTIGVMIELGIPWWVITLIALSVVVIAVVAYVASRNVALRAIAAVLAVQGVAIAIVAPFVMDEDDDEDTVAMRPSDQARGPADAVFSPPQAESPTALRWGPVPGVPDGMEGTGVYGNPSKPELYALRIRMPDKYFMPPHLQPEAEIMTVIRGTLIVGIGEGFDRERAEVLRAGSVAILPARKPHYFRAVGETTVQVEGIGPLNIRYVNPADAPDE
jgi:quercetin dioxygenase-like cupin family protein